MPSTNTKLQDKAIDHAVDLHRYSNGVVRRMVAVLNRSNANIVAQLTTVLAQIDASQFTVERLEALLGSVRALNEAAYQQVLTELQPELRALAEYEAGFQARSMSAAVPESVQVRFPIAPVATEQVYAAALSRPFQGRLLAGWFKDLPESRMRLVRNTIRAGYVEGKTTADIVRTIKGTKALGYADGIMDRSRRDVVTMVRRP